MAERVLTREAGLDEESYQHFCDEETTSNGPVIEVLMPRGKMKEFNDYDVLRQEILNGNVSRDFKARIKAQPSPDESGQTPDMPWSTIEEIAHVDFKLQSLYKPVWAHAKKGLWIGALIGIAIKAIDTATLLASAGSEVVVIWLLVGAAMVSMSIFNRGWMVAAAVGFFSFKFGINVFGFLGAWFSTALVGAFYGGLLGLAIGTIVGYARKRSLEQADDAPSEGRRPLVTGLAIPLATLAVAAPLHIFWLTPKIVEWLS